MYDELYHHGVLGQKWGVRRSLEELGHKVKTKARRGKEVTKSVAKKASAKIKDPKFRASVKRNIPYLAASVLVNVGSRIIMGNNPITSALVYEAGEAYVDRFFEIYNEHRNRV